MMYMPSKEELRLRENVRPWIVFDPKKDKFVLSDEAPDSVRADLKKLSKLFLKDRPNFYY